MSDTIKIQLHTDLGGHRAGQILTVQACNGIPLDRYWRDRLKDSEIDGCISVVTTKPTRADKKAKEE